MRRGDDARNDGQRQRHRQREHDDPADHAPPGHLTSEPSAFGVPDRAENQRDEEQQVSGVHAAGVAAGESEHNDRACTGEARRPEEQSRTLTGAPGRDDRCSCGEQAGHHGRVRRAHVSERHRGEHAVADADARHACEQHPELTAGWSRRSRRHQCRSGQHCGTKRPPRPDEHRVEPTQGDGGGREGCGEQDHADAGECHAGQRSPVGQRATHECSDASSDLWGILTELAPF